MTRVRVAASPPLAARSPDAQRRGRGAAWLPWLGAALATLAAWAALTWPLPLNLGDIWHVRPVGQPPPTRSTPARIGGGDALQSAVIQKVVFENLTNLRNPYVDWIEGAAGPEPLRTSSLDVPWVLVTGLLMPAVGLLAAYQANLVLAALLTGLATFGWLRRHTRWPLLALSGALAYTLTPNRMFQSVGHFNAFMWWAFPAALWAWEVTLERYRAGRRWRGPAAALAAVLLTVALSGELHLTLFITGLFSFLVLWELGAGLAGRRRAVPWAPLATAAAVVGAGAGYALWVFGYVFRWDVAGENGQYSQVELYAPTSVLSLVRKDFGVLGEGLIYVGWPLALLAAAGFVVVVARRRAALAYALLTPVLLLLAWGPAADVGPVRLYRFLADHVPFVSLQRVTGRYMVVTALLLVFLAVVAVDELGARLAAGWRPWGARLAVAVLALATALLVLDYRLLENDMYPSHAGNAVVRELSRSGESAGPILGLPIFHQSTTWNSVTTYVAALSDRRTLNAYNQTPAPWLHQRVEALRSLNVGEVTPSALAVLDATGTRQLLVANNQLDPGEWERLVRLLVGSGEFRLVTMEAPFALLERTGGATRPAPASGR